MTGPIRLNLLLWHPRDGQVGDIWDGTAYRFAMTRLHQNGGISLKLVSSAGDATVAVAGNQVGLISRATVTLHGPTLNGKQDRGVAQIKVGFIQNLQAIQHCGIYGPGPGGRPITATSEQQGVYWWWDSIDGQQGKWYDSRPSAMFTNSAPDGAGGGLRTATITTVDAPAAGPRLNFHGHNLTQMQLVWNFRLFVAAQTTDAHLIDDSQNVYAAQSEASWQFDGSGTIGNAPQYAWTQTGAGVTAPAGWSAVQHQMNLSGKQFNSILKHTARWT